MEVYLDGSQSEKKGGRIDFGSQISLTLSLHQFLSNRGRPENIL